MLSGNGLVAAFISAAPDLADNDTNGLSDVFVQDLTTGVIQLVSVSADGARTGNSGSRDPRLSDDGSVVVFTSNATDLVDGVVGLNTLQQIYVRTLTGTPQTRLASIAPDGVTAGNQVSSAPVLSGDGSTVSFSSQASNLINGTVTGVASQIYARRLDSDLTSLVSVSVAGGTAGINVAAAASAISRDGNRVLFVTSASDVVANDTNLAGPSTGNDVFVRVLEPPETILASENVDGTGPSNGNSTAASLSSDGLAVVFQSTGTDLHPLDTNNATDIYLRTLDGAPETTLVSINLAGTGPGNSGSTGPVISGDGTLVAFRSNASNVALNATNTNGNLYARTLTGTPTTTLINVRFSGGGNAGFGVGEVGVSEDASMVFFTSRSPNLVDDDVNGQDDVFVRRLVGAPVTAITSVAPVGTVGNVRTVSPRLSIDGRRMVFLTTSSNLIADDRNNEQDSVPRRMNFDEPAVAQPIAVSTLEDTVLRGRVRGQDASGFILLFATYSVATQPTQGTLSLRANGAFTYTPNANANGPDTFSFTVNNGAFQATADVNVTVDGANDRPVATASSASGREARDIAGNVVGTDVEDDPLTFLVATQPQNGAVVMEGDGAFVYTPVDGFSGSDAVTFIANDGSDDSVPATVTITVTPNTPPVTVPPTLEGNEDGSLSGQLGGDDDDGDGLSFALVTQATKGTAVVNADGSFVYTPNLDATGADSSFSYTVSDGTATSAPGVVNITLAAIDDPPVVADPPVVSIGEDGSASGQLEATDPDGDPLEFALVAQAQNGPSATRPPRISTGPTASATRRRTGRRRQRRRSSRSRSRGQTTRPPPCRPW